MIHFLLFVIRNIITHNHLSGFINRKLKMYQQYMNQAQAKLTSLSSDDLNTLLYDDSKLEARVNEVVRLVNMIDYFITQYSNTYLSQNCS